jgi:hypothetical protein
MATTIVLTIPAVTIYVNLGFEVASCDAIAEESIPTLSAPGEEKKMRPVRAPKKGDSGVCSVDVAGKTSLFCTPRKISNDPLSEKNHDRRERNERMVDERIIWSGRRRCRAVG